MEVPCCRRLIACYAGEANVASSSLDDDGNLRISVHRGAFTHPEVAQRAAAYW
jgi:hypothetical protein